MHRFLITVLFNMASLAVVASGLLPGIRIEGTVLPTLAVTAVVFGLINAFIKPILRFLTCPFIILSLGLFLFVINALLLLMTAAVTRWLQQYLGGELIVDGFWWAVVGSLIIAGIDLALEAIFDVDNKRRIRTKQVEVRYVVDQNRSQLDREFDAYIASQNPGQYYAPPPTQMPPQQFPPQQPMPPQYPAQGAPPQQFPPQQMPPTQYPPQVPPAAPPQPPPPQSPQQPPRPPGQYPLPPR
jgi:putative membrane protein